MELFLSLLFLLGVAAGICPDRSVIEPCTCDDQGSMYTVTCDGFRNYDDLQQVIDNSLDYRFMNFLLSQCTMPYLNATWLNEKKVYEFRTNHTTLVDLFYNPNETVPYVETVVLNTTKILRGFRWEQLGLFPNLLHLTVESSGVQKLGADFRASVPNSLSSLAIVNSKVQALEDADLADKTKLQYISMSGNKIKVLENSYFKDQMHVLSYMDFSFNPIEYIPDDLFNGMGNLKDVHLDGIKIKTLSSTFNNFKIDLYIKETPLICDCKMQWIPGKSRDLRLYGNCDFPPSLKSRSLESLTPEDFGACIANLSNNSPFYRVSNISVVLLRNSSRNF